MTAKNVKFIKGRWSETQVRMLKQLYYSKTSRNIAEHLGRSEHSVREKTHRLHLRKTKRRSRATVPVVSVPLQIRAAV